MKGLEVVLCGNFWARFFFIFLVVVAMFLKFAVKNECHNEYPLYLSLHTSVFDTEVCQIPTCVIAIKDHP